MSLVRPPSGCQRNVKRPLWGKKSSENFRGTRRNTFNNAGAGEAWEYLLFWSRSIWRPFVRLYCYYLFPNNVLYSAVRSRTVSSCFCDGLFSPPLQAIPFQTWVFNGCLLFQRCSEEDGNVSVLWFYFIYLALTFCPPLTWVSSFVVWGLLGREYWHIAISKNVIRH